MFNTKFSQNLGRESKWIPQLFCKTCKLATCPDTSLWRSLLSVYSLHVYIVKGHDGWFGSLICFLYPKCGCLQINKNVFFQEQRCFVVKHYFLNQWLYTHTRNAFKDKWPAVKQIPITSKPHFVASPVKNRHLVRSFSKTSYRSQVLLRAQSLRNLWYANILFDFISQLPMTNEIRISSRMVQNPILPLWLTSY